MRWVFVIVLALVAKQSAQAATSTVADLKNKPSASSCNQEELRRSRLDLRQKIQNMRRGVPPSGNRVAGAIMRVNDCNTETGVCTPLSQPPSEFSYYVNDAITDPCLRYCVLVHEWEHFVDKRPWSMKQADDALAVFLERPAYLKQEQCVAEFLRPLEYSSTAPEPDSASQ